MTPQALNVLAAAVQRNCHIADARYGADYSLCIYLMKMREYYRWEMRLPFGAPLEKDAVGDWLSARERLWEELEGAELQPLPIDGACLDPFDADAINARLGDHGLVYSSGLGNRAQPHFFLGALERRTEAGGCAVYVAATEYARDLAAPPAMTRGRSIFLRRESLHRMLWEKLESWRWNRPDNALGRAFACYPFDADLDGALTAMTDHEINAVLLHEQGEVAAGQCLGEPAWNAMLMDLALTPAELMARAVRDHLADCLVTLPYLTGSADAEPDVAGLHFYLGNLTAMRRAIFPGLAAAYEQWHRHGDLAILADSAERGRVHWAQLGQAMLALHHRHGEEAAEPIRQLVDANHL
ncbi:MAG: hypothetical protein EA400_09390 [Chromatiaceae bacterium]|nr:MAG: hypothetical protein EA400_09390 [Chromatiaceae bacterium]